MNLKDLKYFVEVSRTRHFGRAAKKCFVSQPTLSGQIKKLEEELGVALFERNNKSVSLTPVAELLLPRAEKILNEADELKLQAESYKDPLAGRFKLGAIPTISPYLLPGLIPSLRQDYPQISLQITEDMTESLLQKLGDGSIDAALIATEIDDTNLVSRLLYKEPFWLAFSRDNDLYLHDGPIGLKELEQQEMLLLGEGHCLRSQLIDICNLSTISSDNIDFYASSLESIIQLVGAGMGVTLIPATALRGSLISGSGVVVRQLDFDASRDILLVWRKTWPRIQLIDALTELIQSNLPNTVRVNHHS